jgi:X-X-X-Leu-X-X-Gly heptad repeat protein
VGLGAVTVPTVPTLVLTGAAVVTGIKVVEAATGTETLDAGAGTLVAGTPAEVETGQTVV